MTLKFTRKVESLKNWTICAPSFRNFSNLWGPSYTIQLQHLFFSTLASLPSWLIRHGNEHNDVQFYSVSTFLVRLHIKISCQSCRFNSIEGQVMSSHFKSTSSFFHPFSPFSTLFIPFPSFFHLSRALSIFAMSFFSLAALLTMHKYALEVEDI